jgi:suppressor of G2 allele of SKP1
MSTQADMGAKALAAKDYTSAISHYTNALKTSKSPIWLIQRSIAYHRAGNYALALLDAEAGVLGARLRARRELIASAQMRRAIALYSLGRLGDSRLVLTWVRRLNEKEKSLGVWQLKVANEYEKLPEDAEGRKVSVHEIPDEATLPETNTTEAEEVTVVKGNVKKPEPATSQASQAPVPAHTPKEKIRHEWYQSSNKVTITIFAKGISKELAEVTINSDSVSFSVMLYNLLELGANSAQVEVHFPIGSNSNYNFSIEHLYDQISPSESAFSITPNKLEITLHKNNTLKWPALEGASQVSSPLSKESKDLSTSASLSITANKPPTYPTSSKHGPKNWDALARSALAAESTDQEKLANDDDEEGDPLHGFFKKLYKDADPDTKRAMMKSYTESNGTALSTNWEDVGKKKVETNPPEGLEAKTWEK